MKSERTMEEKEEDLNQNILFHLGKRIQCQMFIYFQIGKQSYMYYKVATSVKQSEIGYKKLHERW